MPTTRGAAALHGAADEAALLYARLPHPVLLSSLSETAALLPTGPNVLAQLDRCAIAHFACHGVSDPGDPSRSRLLLQNYQTDPLTVAAIGRLRLEHAQLVFLSACRSSLSPTVELADESIHLAAAFQLAGFRQAIGTLWEIDDFHAARVSKDFYTALNTGTDTANGTLEAARALHVTLRAARKALPQTPSLWGGFLHLGA
jgi:CHAT domain-containing protein